MSMKCSVLGHKYGPEKARTETNASENGDIETLQRVKECTRCGHEKVVSENKQVRPTDSPSVDVAADGGDATTPDATETDDSLAHGYDVEQDDAVIIGGDDSADPADTVEDGASDTASQPRYDVENEEEGVAFIGGSDSDSNSVEAEESAEDESASADADHEAAVEAGRGAEILGASDDEGDDGADDATSAQAKGLEDPPEEFPTAGSDAVFIDNDPSETRPSAESAPETATDDAPSPGRGDAVIIPSEESAGDESEPTVAEVATPDRTQQRSTPRSERPVPEDARYLTCSDCSYREAQTRECRWAGDACPQCRSAFLKWEDN